METKKKVALYCRCSTKKQDLESQLDRLKDWATKNSYDYEVYQDFAVSGRKDDREGINKLLKDVKDGGFSYVAVVELSRIGRSIGFITTTVKQLKEMNVKICLANSNTILDYDSLEGGVLINALAMASDIEWRLIRERNQRARDAIKTRNIKVGRKQVKISTEAINALKSKGMSLREIANEMGVSAPTIMRRFKTGQLCNVTESNTNLNKV